MRYHLLVFAALAGMASNATASSPILLTVNDYGDAGPGNCATTCTLRDALHDIADGGIIEFAPRQCRRRSRSRMARWSS